MIKQFFWLLPFISFITGYYVISICYHVAHLQTPSLVGQTLQTTFKILSEHNLYPRLLAQRQDPDLPNGTILSQTPHAGSSIKPYQSVYCVVSVKPTPLTAPLLVTKTIPIIKKELAEHNIKVKIYYLNSNKPIDYCIAQLPVAGNPVLGQIITIYASRGNNKPVICPHFIGKSIDDVIEFCEQYNIQPEIISEKNNMVNLSHDIIIDQRPLPGSIITIDRQNSIKLYVQ